MAVPGPIRRAAASPPFGGLVGLLERIVPARRDALAVLTFHRVAADGPEIVPGLLSSTPAGFAALLDTLARRHEILDIEAVLRRARGGPALPRRALLLTFDDAYADFAEHAWPALDGRGLPAVVFVPTAYPDAPDRAFWWDRLYAAVRESRLSAIAGPGGPLPLATAADRQVAYRHLRGTLKAMPHEAMLGRVDELVAALGSGAPSAAATPPAATPAGASPTAVLGWEALRDLRAAGVALAPHTRTHPLLTRVPAAAATTEITGSRDDLTRETGSELAVLAYPSGATSVAVADAARAAGIEIAFTTERGTNDLRTADWLALRRINVSVRTPDALVRAQMLG
jgi:peptidoglycan/xylan/chitin deacetylase (PgdA/CDA1 family)